MPPNATNHTSSHPVRASQKVKQFFGIPLKSHPTTVEEKADEATDLLCYQGDRQEVIIIKH
ncbi:hypothetical protein H310_13571 [Aphanomyces invadans]|uniref:Uncharacterized protein n=1 Tax=Aphanomyces invadans TaxID=157072 RepID=A0A024TEM9_9STRA|nr:hypothetical protein H310_13571 [Aphanomyces invadans]ETV92046.1 hypothetical protein H310_13571 [Aphanomyces invadans]|eukprot:XP_008879343.1 hypothetical protein H310_13571 [Aphanomyces invadans]